MQQVNDEQEIDDGLELEDASTIFPEKIEHPFDPSEIKVGRKIVPISSIVQRIDHNEIDLSPDFQRRARIWDPVRKSRLIESILLRIPLPVFYVASDLEENWKVVDGLQRLTTIYDFIKSDTKNSFVLKGLEYLPEGATSRGVLALFNYYLGLVSTGAAVSVQDLSEIDSVSATFSFTGQSELPMERIRPTNVGFGLSYVSAIIITCLIAQRGDLIIIENPEAHLHTTGQRAVIDLLIRTARSGIQVICESHSREMLYCARQKVIDNAIPSDLASVLYVYLESDGGLGHGTRSLDQLLNSDP